MAIALPVARRRPGTWRRRLGETATGYAFLAPAILILGVFILGSSLYAFLVSFQRSDLFTSQWIGLANYERLLSYSDFHRALQNVATYTLVVVPTQTALALALALLVQRVVRGRGIFRTVFYLPAVTASVVMGIIFRWLFDRGGWVNFVLRQLDGGVAGLSLGVVHLPWDIPWLQQPETALPAIMSTTIWSTAADFTIIFLAALLDIPSEINEASALDGAVGWRRLWHITLPLLRPAIFLVVALGTIGSLQVFDQIYVMTQGGPLKSTLTPVYLIYSDSFRDFRVGLAAAMASVLFALIMLVTVVQRRFIDTTIEY